MEVLSPLKVDTSLDFKMTKNDLIELMVDEYRISLDEAYEAANEAHNEAFAELEALQGKLEEEGLKHLKRRYQGLLQSFRAAAKGDVEEDVQFHFDGNDISKISRAKDWDAMVCHASIPDVCRLHLNADIDLHLTFNMDNTFLKEESLIWPDLMEAIKKNYRTLLHRNTLINEQNQFEHKSRKARVSLMRKILASNEKGGEILQKLDTARRSIRIPMLGE